MPEKTYRVAVIGRTGKGNYGHGLDTVWLAVPNAKIVAVADEDEKGREAAVARLKAPAGYADFREMLRKEKPEVVSVADRWLDRHAEFVKACAEAGASVFLEKPMARTLAEADAMIEACDRHHVKLAIAHQTRSSPRVAVVKELIAAGRIGEVVELRGRGKEDARGGGQDLMVLGTHVLDLMRALVGDARWCFARVWQEGRPAAAGDTKEGGEGMGPILGDRIVAQYGFDGGVVGHFGTFKAPDNAGKRFALHVFGSKGVIALTTGSLPAAYLLEDPTWGSGRMKAEWQPITSAGLGKPEPLKDEGLALGNRWIAEDLLKAIAEDREPLSSGRDGRAALEMILAVYESWRQGRPVDLPLKNRQHPLAR
jgi:predicted dehydrogenase